MNLGKAVSIIIAAVIAQSAMAGDQSPENEKKNPVMRLCEQVVSKIDNAAVDLANIQFHVGLHIARATNDVFERLPLAWRESIESWLRDTRNNHVTNNLANAMFTPRAFLGHELSKEIFNAMTIRQDLIALPLMGTSGRPANLLLNSFRDAGPVLDLIRKEFPNFDGDERLWAFEAPNTITLFSRDKNFPDSYKRGTIVVMSGSFPIGAFVVISAE